MTLPTATQISAMTTDELLAKRNELMAAVGNVRAYGPTGKPTLKRQMNRTIGLIIRELGRRAA